MSSKVRKQIYIEPEQEMLLKQIANDTGMSEAAIIRKAIDLYASEVGLNERRLNAWANIQAFIAKRIADQPEQALEGEGRTWRREDLYDRFDRSER
ncbi:MAG: ribbon-helix-helix domain-containing protein [Chloroflexia bacterium]